MAKSLNPNRPTVLGILAPLMLLLAQSSMAEQCGRQAGGAMCPGGACCSQFGWCGTTQNYCGAGCQSQCSGSPSPIPPSPGGGVSSIITQGVFNNMLKHKDDGNCEGKGFYTYNAFITAANAFNGFGTTGSTETRKRELAAFFAQTSHETTGGWDTAPDGRYAWGYCYKTERNHADYCQRTATWGCAGGKQYYGRGPIQLTWNYNYGQAGRAIGFDGINDPDIVARDPVVSFKTAVWFWMTAQSLKPSCHDVMTGRWGGDGPRQPGFGVTTNIINGGLECGKGSVPQQNDRIGFYKRYCDLLGVSYGNNLDCNGQPPFTALTSEVKQQAESSLIRTVV